MSSQVKIIFDELGKTRIYRGKVIENKKNFLILNDRKIGRISLRKKDIVKIEGKIEGGEGDDGQSS